jgi:uncharacterized membrane protein YidH (DUF202 family)
MIRKSSIRPARAVVISLFLMLPFMTLLVMRLLGIEPDLIVFAQSTNLAEDYFGSLIVILAFSLLIPALAINVWAIACYSINETRQTKPWLNIILTMMLAGIIITIFTLVVIDQLPCWKGVPNCD